MADPSIDPSLIQDFLTESSELIEQLDTDLVKLEQVSDAAESQDLLSGVFRALHTIKGAASFLALTEVTTFAHAAEDALNKLRKGEAQVTQEVMDVLLRSVDVVRGMLDEIEQSQPVTPGPGPLIDALHAIAEGKAGQAPGATGAPGDGSNATVANSATDDGRPTEASDSGSSAELTDSRSSCESRVLELAPEKADLLEFMAADLSEQTKRIVESLERLSRAGDLGDTGEQLTEIAEELQKTAVFFDLERLTQLVVLLSDTGKALGRLTDEAAGHARVYLAAMRQLIDEQATALEAQLELLWPLDAFEAAVRALIAEDAAAPTTPPPADEQAVLQAFGLAAGGQAPAPAVDAPLPDTVSPASASQSTAPTGSTSNGPSGAAPNAAAPKTAPPKPGTGSVNKVEQTIRVEVGRLEALLNQVGQLVLAKNRFSALSRGLRDHHLPMEVVEDFGSAASDLDRLTGELQMGVMRTRMQPLAKLFERYPRVIRDIARATGKKINLEIVGKETEVDKSVLEQLADPLVHMLRNSADHGVELPEVRREAGKPETGTIRLSAEHQGSHVRVEIGDDGKGLDREVLGRKAVERGLTTTDQLASLSDEEVFQFIFSAGFSTAEKVSDLSGRGVGMDVVRTNLAKINGAVHITSTKGKGSSFEILIPLTVAIMPAMMVGVGKHLYAIPLTSITEIVRPEDTARHTVGGRPVMTLRESVLPLMDLRERLGEAGQDQPPRFAVVVAVGQSRAGLMVDRLIGQQEVVIKPLDDTYTTGGPFSGATIREDGDVSLILDVIKLIRQAQVPGMAATAAANTATEASASTAAGAAA